MTYKAELDYLVKVLKKMNMQVLVIPRGEKPESGVDLGLRKTLGVRTGFENTFSCPSGWAEERTVYKI